jgi:hypothetical protein
MIILLEGQNYLYINAIYRSKVNRCYACEAGWKQLPSLIYAHKVGVLIEKRCKKGLGNLILFRKNS